MATKLKLKPEEYNILKTILKNGPILVPELTNELGYDRGKVEGSIAVLVREKLVDRNSEEIKIHKLTERGIEASKGLAERIILDKLANDSLNMSDLAKVTKLDKSNMTAGIGILKKANIISIDHGILSIIDEKKASTFSKDVEKALEDLQNGKDRIKDDETSKILISRGFIEQIEKNQITVVSKIKESDFNNIQSVEEVSKLTPELILSGNWREVTFKPYSMDVKPRIVYAGRYHPYKNFVDHLRLKLIGLGFQEMKGPLVEQEFWNFDALYAAQDHPAREDSDILLIKEPSYGNLQNKSYIKNVQKAHEDGWKTGSKGYGYKWNPKRAARLLLRPQGTSISARTLSMITQPPAKYFSVARCFRPDQVDATHAIEFDQTEGIIVGENLTFRDLLGMLKTFAVEVAGASEVRFRPDFYPFTSPSVELSARHPVLGHIEFGGAGIFRPEVTQPFGIEEPVLAWGLGVGRLFMTKYQINDIRELFSQNIDYLRNELVASGINPE